VASPNLKTIRHQFGGGWSPDFGPTITQAPTPQGEFRIPYLMKAENCGFELDGGPRKIGGATKLNSSALESGAAIRGLFDFWRIVSGSPNQTRVLHVNSKIMADAADGTFADIGTGFSTSSIPSYATFNDSLILSSTGGDVPQSWAQAGNVANLAGSPPNFAFGIVHKNRFWAAGVDANPSNLYYSALLDGEDWTGAGSGFIQIDPDDGDRITGLASHKNEVWVFKGPYQGSIHRIAGSAPTGDDGFQRLLYVSGLGAMNHNCIFRFRDDIGFVAPQGTVHSLNATAAFGDFLVSSLSFPLNNWLLEHVNNSALNQSWAAVDEIAGCVRITLPIDGAAAPNAMLCMDFRRSNAQGAPEMWWSLQPAYDWPVVARVLDAGDSDKPILMAGGDDGFVRKLDQRLRNIDDTDAIAYTVHTPHMNYGSGLHMKLIHILGAGVAPKGNHDLTLGWQRDDSAEQTVTVTQGSGGAVLGPWPSNEFKLGTSRLAGAEYSERFAELEDGGEFRSIQYRLAQSGLNEDAEVHTITSLIAPGPIVVEDV
jgi:hypothetical protein